MSFEISLADYMAGLIALLSLWVAIRALDRSKNNDLFALRQSVLLKSEIVRSGWYKLRHENDLLVAKVTLRIPNDSPGATIIINFLKDHREHLDMCISDAIAMAEDVHKNIESFNEKKCRDYLRIIDPSLEKITRNQGVAEQKINILLDQFDAKFS